MMGSLDDVPCQLEGAQSGPVTMLHADGFAR